MTLKKLHVLNADGYLNARDIYEFLITGRYENATQAQEITCENAVLTMREILSEQQNQIQNKKKEQQMLKNFQLYLFDLDGTLTEPISGKTFPETVDDRKWMPGRLERIQGLHNEGKKTVMGDYATICK